MEITDWLSGAWKRVLPTGHLPKSPAGLKEGDRVLLSSDQDLKAGVQVRQKAAEP